MKVSRFGLKIGMVLAALLVAISVAVPASAAKVKPLTLVVDDNADKASCKLASAFTTIQSAINVIPKGQDAIIKVCPGTYNEKLDIGGRGKVTLQGIKMPVINSPDGWDALMIASGGATTVKGFVINTTRNGIIFSNTSGAVSGVTINGLTNSQSGISITNNSEVNVTGNKVIGTQYGIYIQRTTDAITVSKNTLSGMRVAGVRMEGANSVTISGNSIDGAEFSSGVFAQDVTSLTVSGNTMLVRTGVFVTEGCQGANASPIEQLTISKNKITLPANAQQGRGIQVKSAVEMDSTCDPIITGAKITGNTLIGNASAVGIEMAPGEYVGVTFLPGIHNATISGNTLKQFGSSISVPDNQFVTGMVYSKNKCDGAACP